MDRQVTRKMYGFPGGDTGKRWHLLREVTELDKHEFFVAYYLKTGDLTSICGTWGIAKHNFERAKAHEDRFSDILIESDALPHPFCGLCERKLKSI